MFKLYLYIFAIRLSLMRREKVQSLLVVSLQELFSRTDTTEGLADIFKALEQEDKGAAERFANAVSVYLSR